MIRAGLVLVRHAESLLSAGLAGRGADPDHLTARGRAQACHAAVLHRAMDGDVTRIVCSPTPRARETAAIIAAAGSHRRLWTDPVLTEHPGVAARIAELRSGKRDSPDAAWTAYVDAVRAWLERQRHRPDRIVVVTHAGWMLAAQQAWGQAGSVPRVPRHCDRLLWHDSQWHHVDREG